MSPYIAYVDREFKPGTQRVIQQAHDIIEEYVAAGYTLTLRQLYYQFVSRDLLPNRIQSYKRLGSIVNDARLAGLIDWDHIEDRTRNLQQLASWDDPPQLLRQAARQFRRDPWRNQHTRVEVWVEKDALVGVFEPVCDRYGVPLFACRGYPSQSEVWSHARRFGRYLDGEAAYDGIGQDVVVLHFGDHDPSGVDMTDDLVRRFRMFEVEVSVRRLALNHDQIRQYQPPPNPAKFTDSRAKAYIAAYGRSSWELDALEPQVLAALIDGAIQEYIEDEPWERDMAIDKADRERMVGIALEWRETYGEDPEG